MLISCIRHNQNQQSNMLPIKNSHRNPKTSTQFQKNTCLMNELSKRSSKRKLFLYQTSQFTQIVIHCMYNLSLPVSVVHLELMATL